MTQKVSIYDIATIAGVSPSTVSNVINGRTSKMSAATREKVLACLAQTGYRANMVARNLVTGRSMLIGVCLPVLEANATQSNLLENNPFYHEFIDGVSRVLLDRGYECIVRGMDSNFKYLEWVQNRCLDGLIDLGHLSNEVHEELSSLSVPVVLVDNYDSTVEQDGYDVIVSDDKYGAYLAAKHLLELGHRRIGFVHSRVDDIGVDAERYKGYKQALDEFNVTDEYVYKIVLDYSNGLNFGHKIVEDNLPITAVFCTADIAAVGIAHGIEECGKHVPQDYSVVGFDDIKLMQYITPRLTTVRQNIFEKGSMCARVLLDRLDNPDTHLTNKTVIQPELIVRDSTRRLQ